MQLFALRSALIHLIHDSCGGNLQLLSNVREKEHYSFRWPICVQGMGSPFFFHMVIACFPLLKLDLCLFPGNWEIGLLSHLFSFQTNSCHQDHLMKILSQFCLYCLCCIGSSIQILIRIIIRMLMCFSFMQVVFQKGTLRVSSYLIVVCVFYHHIVVFFCTTLKNTIIIS